ncbi:MAG TPA: hypothetical protein DIT29_06250 [Pseudothermotoga sp.]|nr:hypothetical protein [Pseudothermotoga sp.]HCO98306.1 hypothetical protein [Pseudothermotoga sp.]
MKSPVRGLRFRLHTFVSSGPAMFTQDFISLLSTRTILRREKDDCHLETFIKIDKNSFRPGTSCTE